MEVFREASPGDQAVARAGSRVVHDERAGGTVRTLLSAMTSAATLAPPPELYCLFRRGGIDFAVPARAARRAVPVQPLTPVPFAPPDLCGVFLDRRRVVPVVRLDRWLGLAAAALPRDGAWLLIDDGNVTLAAVVDRVLGMASFADRGVKRALAHPLASGMVAHEARTVVLLDAERLVATVTGSLLAALPQHASAS
jgi:chemotaxis signal transduction protein